MKHRIVDLGFLFIIGFILIFITTNCKNDNSKSISEIQEVVEKEIIHEVKYGIIVDSLITYTDKVKRNQNLSDILTEYGLPYNRIHELVVNTKDVFNVRKIRSGNKYSLFTTNDSINPKILYFIYEESATSYLVYDFNDSIHAHRGEKEIEIRIAYANGAIKSSLWNALSDNGADAFVSVLLSEVYAWEIDFFGIQKNDEFWVKYEELYVDGEKIGVGKVLSCLFNHINSNYYAFYFVQDSIGAYFDEEANSLQKTFLKAPLRYSRISSKFSNSRLHPILKIRRPHHGVDYAAPKGTPVVTIGDGVVVKAAKSGGAGRMVKIKHNGTYSTAYLHLQGYGKGVKQGAKVQQGQIIGYVGSSGLSTGPHLDFRVYKNGQAIDPLKMKSPPSKPVDSANLDVYNNFLKKELYLLDSVVNIKLDTIISTNK